MRDVQQAYKIYREITEDKELMQQIQALEDAKHNEAAALANAEKKGEKIGEKKGEKKARTKIVKNLLALNAPMEMIVSASGMSESEINALR